MVMDLRRLRYFVTVARLGSFTRAAAALNMAQPPLSQRIQELEAELGLTLLERDARPLRMTAAGRLLYEQAVQILGRTEAMLASLRRLTTQERPVFRLGLVPANFHGSLSRIIRRYRRALPGVEVRILEMNSLEQAEALRDGRIDAGISRLEVVAPGVSRIVLREEPLVAALPADHPLAALEEAMTLEALRHEPFILYANPPRPSLADHVMTQFAARGIALSRILEVGQYDTAMIMIAAGEGVSVVPASARLVVTADIAYRPLVEQITSPIVLCHREDDETPELRAFALTLAEDLSERKLPVPPLLERPSLSA
jgi:DNA-binding transcriptional LysR family regulator